MDSECRAIYSAHTGYSRSRTVSEGFKKKEKAEDQGLGEEMIDNKTKLGEGEDRGEIERWKQKENKSGYDWDEIGGRRVQR